MITKYGAIMSNYFNIDRVSASGLKKLVVSYEHYSIETKKTSAMDFGTLVHTLALEPHEYNNTFVCENIDKRKPKERARAKEIEESGLILIDNKQLFQAKKMAESIHNHDLFTLDGEIEKEIYWNYNDVECKSKIDVVTDNYIMDIKTIDSLDKAINRVWYEYAIQARFYQLADYQQNGFLEKPFRFFFVEKQAPYACICLEAGDGVLSKGQGLIDRGIQNYKLGKSGIKTLKDFEVIG